MKKYVLKITVIICVLLTVKQCVWAQSGTPQGDYEGYDFWAAFMPNNNNNPNNTLSFNITSRYATTATISTPLIAGGLNTTINITANGVTSVTIPSTLGTAAYAMDQPTVNAPYPSGIHITSPYPISVFGSNVYTATSETWLNIPTAFLGTDYVSVAFTGYATGTLPSELMVLATAPGTTTVNFTAPAGKVISGQGATFSISLIQGQVYLVQSLDPTTEADAYELTGLHITSNQPIALYGGSDCTGYPETGNRGGYASCGPCDHLVEMITPTSTWGGNYVIGLFAFTKAGGADNGASSNVTTKGNYIRIVSDEPAASTVAISGQASVTLNGIGDYTDRIITTHTLVSTPKKISVYQIMAATSCYSAIVTSGYGDPCFTNITPVEQWGTNYAFATPTGAAGFTHYITIIKRSNIGKVSLDGAAQAGFTNILGTNYYVLNGINIAAGVHNLTGDSIFTVTAYGDELADGYCNQVSGASLKPIQLPVTYVSFAATLVKDNHIQLNWVSGQEKNAMEYVAEKMVDGNFKPFGTIPAVGNSNLPKTYAYQDPQPNEGLNYYRLKQIDYNGHVYYSNTITTNVPYNSMHIMHTEWANSSTLQLSISAVEADLITFSLYDIQGRCIKKQTEQLASPGDQVISLNTGNVAPGVYFLQILGQNKTIQELKIVR